MGNLKQTNKRVQATKKSNKKVLIFGGIIILLIVAFIVITLNPGKKDNTAAADNTATTSGDLKILKSEVSQTARFYPYKAGKMNMEVLAVKASDGTIRTAFNTCQVCFDSGRGYYKQEGNELVCQNCGNRFKLDQVEKIKGGCNPVPIMKENKTDDSTNIIISQAFMEENKDLFGNWRK